MYFIAVAPIKYICKQKGELTANFIYMYPITYIKAKVRFFFLSSLSRWITLYLEKQVQFHHSYIPRKSELSAFHKIVPCEIGIN